MKILLLFLVSFSLSANHHTDSRKVNIAAKLRESSPDGNVLSAPTISVLTGTKGVIAVEQEGAEDEKQGFRMAVQPSISENGILLEVICRLWNLRPKED